MDIKKATREYVEVSAAIARIDALAKSKKEPLQQRLQEIKDDVHAHLKESKLKGVDIEAGSWTKSTSTSYKISDKDAFAEFLRDQPDAGDYIQATIIKAKAQEMADAGSLPDFVSVFSREEVKFTPRKK